MSAATYTTASNFCNDIYIGTVSAYDNLPGSKRDVCNNIQSKSDVHNDIYLDMGKAYNNLPGSKFDVCNNIQSKSNVHNDI